MLTPTRTPSPPEPAEPTTDDLIPCWKGKKAPFSITMEELETCELTHRHAGNNYFMVEDLGGEYCRISGIGDYKAGRIGRAFMVWKRLLSPTRMPAKPGDEPTIVTIEDRANRHPGFRDFQEALETTRAAIKAGTVFCVETHLQKA